MSWLTDRVDEATAVVEADGWHVRIRRPTTAEICSAELGAVLAVPLDGERMSGPPPKPNGAAPSKPEAPVDPVMAARLRVQEARNAAHVTAQSSRLLADCVLGAGPSVEQIEPCTITLTERDRTRPGTVALPIHAVPKGVINALTTWVYDQIMGGGWRERVAAFPAGGAGDARPDGEPLRMPAKRAAR